MAIKVRFLGFIAFSLLNILQSRVKSGKSGKNPGKSGKNPDFFVKNRQMKRCLVPVTKSLSKIHYMAIEVRFSGFIAFSLLNILQSRVKSGKSGKNPGKSGKIPDFFVKNRQMKRSFCKYLALFGWWCP